MKKFKKLIPAFCAMLISAVMLGTSTYAWFSVNKKVTVNDLSVTAQANTQYFVVSNAPETLLNKVVWGTSDGTLTKTGGINNNAVVYPAAYGQEGAMSGNGWYTGNTSVYDEPGNTHLINVTELLAGSTTVFENNSNYFVGYTFYVGLAANSDAYAGNDGNGDILKVKATTDSANGIAVAAVKIEQYEFDTESEPNEWKAGANKETLPVAGSTAIIPSTTKFSLEAGSKCVKVTVYVYIDGTNENVKDSKANTLTGSVSIQVGGASENLSA